MPSFASKEPSASSDATTSNVGDFPEKDTKPAATARKRRDKQNAGTNQRRRGNMRDMKP